MKLAKHVFALTTALTAIGFETKNGWKTTEDGAIETDGEGNPIYVDDSGSEKTIAPGYINRLNQEAANHRNAARDAQQKLEAFGDLDPKAAREAIEKMSEVNLDELVNKGEIDKVRIAVTEQMGNDIAEREKQISERDKTIEKLALDNAFNSSEFLNERLAVPVDAARATFRDRFRYDAERGKVVPTTETGDPLLNKHGDIASVDEAMETFINARSDSETWIKAPEAGGSGSQGAGGGRGGSNVMKKSEYDSLAQQDKAVVGQKVAKGELKLVD